MRRVLRGDGSTMWRCVVQDVIRRRRWTLLSSWFAMRCRRTLRLRWAVVGGTSYRVTSTMERALEDTGRTARIWLRNGWRRTRRWESLNLYGIASSCLRWIRRRRTICWVCSRQVI
uniref:(northern house mosquito) hypothetical protein n=1 Tax=Culex pipiens TaxID=7175 RepID=A0A8D8AN90_CULPI